MSDLHQAYLSLSSIIRLIEARLGRIRSADKNAPRTIDLDIVMYGRMRIDERALCVPHPSALKRAFVMLPLEEIAPKAARTLKTLTKPKPRAKRKKA